MEFHRPVTELIRERRSVRNYADRILEPEAEEKVRELLQQHTAGPMGNTVRFHLVEGKSNGEKGKVKVGTYGFIKGARYFIAGELSRENYAEQDYGYLLEKLMLHFWEMGLGTCWLGGTFKRSEFLQVLGSSENTFIPAVSPLGYPANRMSNREVLIRKGAGSDRRKAWKELFFDCQPGKTLHMREDDPFYLPLEMVRLAPSASNKQPWRILRCGNTFHFLLERTPGYGKAVKAVDLQRIDMGIAMAHFELSCQEAGLKGNWTLDEPDLKLPEGTSYTVSWRFDF